MSLRTFLGKQFIDVIQWNEDEDGVLAYRYPMQDMEIQTGGQLTVRESQLAVFVNEGRIADVFRPGLYTLNTRNLPLLTGLRIAIQIGRVFLLHAAADRPALGDGYAHHHSR